jgi:hypothetical protein
MPPELDEDVPDGPFRRPPVGEGDLVSPGQTGEGADGGAFQRERIVRAAIPFEDTRTVFELLWINIKDPVWPFINFNYLEQYAVNSKSADFPRPNNWIQSDEVAEEFITNAGVHGDEDATLSDEWTTVGSSPAFNPTLANFLNDAFVAAGTHDQTGIYVLTPPALDGAGTIRKVDNTNGDMLRLFVPNIHKNWLLGRNFISLDSAEAQVYWDILSAVANAYEPDPSAAILFVARTSEPQDPTGIPEDLNHLFLILVDGGGSFPIRTFLMPVRASIPYAALNIPAFPPLVASQSTGNLPFGTSWTPTLPTGIQVGNLLLTVFIVGSAITNPVLTAGWTIIDVETATGGPQFLIAAKIATGSDALTLSVNPAGSNWASHVSFCITGANSLADIEYSYSSSGTTTTTISFAALTPTGGLTERLWLAVAGWLGVTTADVSSFPSGYSNGQDSAPTGSTVRPAAASSYKVALSTTETPGNMVLTANRTSYHSINIAIRA